MRYLKQENVSKHKVQEDVDIEKYKRGLKLGSLPELHSRVTVAGYPTGGDNISVTRGVVSRIEPQPYGAPLLRESSLIFLLIFHLKLSLPCTNYWQYKLMRQLTLETVVAQRWIAKTELLV